MSTSSIPMYEQIQNELMEQIQSGFFQPGDRIPSEKELAERYHVSRITAVKALTELALNGYIYRVQGRGSFANPLDKHLKPSALKLGGVPKNDGEPCPVSVLIPDKDAAPLLERCVDSILRKTTWPNYEVVICENNSTQPQTFAYYRQAERDSRVRVLQVPCPDGPSFSHVCNVGVREARGEYVILLNNDTEVMSPDWIELLLGPVRFEGMGAAGAKLLYPDELIQHAGVQIGGVDEPVHYYVCSPGDGPGFYVANILPHRSTAVTGACLLTTKAIWNEVGGMDEGLPFDYDDVDLCLKMRAAGYELLEQSNAVLTHYESATRAKHDAPGQSRVRYLHDLGVIRERFARQLAYPDPYYSPDLLPVYYQLRW